MGSVVNREGYSARLPAFESTLDSLLKSWSDLEQVAFLYVPQNGNNMPIFFLFIGGVLRFK